MNPKTSPAPTKPPTGDPLPMCSRCSIRAASQARWVDPDPSPSSQRCARCGHVGTCWAVYGGVE